VNTVDGFQGQERDIIIISLVRSNEEGQIGFLHDLRRMNVAITRARMKLIILGDVETLTKHKFYKRLHEYIEEI
jgi:superfamily I DNA and/or RNA helicase